MSEQASTSTRDPEWLTVAEIARRLSCSRMQVWKYIHNDQFDDVRKFSPRVVRVSHASYQRFVAQKKNTPS